MKSGNARNYRRVTRVATIATKHTGEHERRGETYENKKPIRQFVQC